MINTTNAIESLSHVMELHPPRLGNEASAEIPETAVLQASIWVIHNMGHGHVEWHWVGTCLLSSTYSHWTWYPGCVYGVEVEGQRPVFWINERLLALASTQQLEPGGFGEKPRESRTSQSLFFKNFCKLETGSCLHLTSMTSHLPTSLKTQTLYCYLTSSFAPVMIS